MSLLASILLACAAPPVQEPSVKDLFDEQLAVLRAAQRQDGSYGYRQETACVLIAMALSPRAYREDDGPFVRDAARSLLSQGGAGDDPAADAAAALALHCLDAQRYVQSVADWQERAGLPRGAAAAVVAAGSWSELGLDQAALAKLPLPLRDGQEMDALSLLRAVPESAGLMTRADACARAAIAYRWSSNRKSGAAASAGAQAAAALAYEQGTGYLLAARSSSGLWEVFGAPEPGISALCAKALLGSSRTEARAAALPALDFLRSLQHEDGSIHQGRLPVYVTSVAIMALAAGGREQDRPAIHKAADYLRGVQSDESEGYSEADKFYGGIGYGGDLRPDLSNLQYALQALREAGAAAEDPAFQRALFFLQRSQNRSESNPETYYDQGGGTPVRAGNDGGAVYYPGNSPAGVIDLPDGSQVARSYGSMTYALLKCYVFAGLERDDPRVQAAVDWVSRYWTLEVNPGFDTLRDPRAGFQGLFYYYLSLAEALQAAGIDQLTGADGVTHDWRSELAAKLVSLQRPDGSWLNEGAERWWEGNPVLCTAYALNALRAARQ